MDKIFKIIPFSTIMNWSALNAFVTIPSSNFEKRHLGEFLKLSKKCVNIKDDIVYKQVRVRTKGKGAVKRKELYGKDIGTKKQFIANEGQLIISKIDARNGAFAIITKELDGAVVTGSFLLYDVINIEIEYLVLILASPIMSMQWLALSSGTTNRRSVDDLKIRDFIIPAPSISEQKEILKTYRATIA